MTHSRSGFFCCYFTMRTLRFSNSGRSPYVLCLTRHQQAVEPGVWSRSRGPTGHIHFLVKGTSEDGSVCPRHGSFSLAAGNIQALGGQSNQLWNLFPPTASEKKSLASRSSVTYHSKVTSWSGSLSSAMRLMPGRQAKDPECRAEVRPVGGDISGISKPGCGISTLLSATCNQILRSLGVWGCVCGFPDGTTYRKPGQGLTVTGNGSGLLFSTKNGRSWNLHLKKQIHFETRQTCFNF